MSASSQQKFSDSLICEPIGIIRTPMQLKFDAPHQPDKQAQHRNSIDLYPGRGFENALSDLAGFERIWLVWWFHRNNNWRPMVHTPRGDTKRRGVFATRSPHRPNPIGITSVPLLEVSGRRLIVGATDLLDGTPILDIKPYVSEVDAFIGQRNGWLEEVEGEENGPRFKVELAPLAQQQVEWLVREWKIDFMVRAEAVLGSDPSPSRRKRITQPKAGVYRLSSGSWRVFFTRTDSAVTVLRIAPGFPRELLLKEGREIIPHFEAQLAFLDLWDE